MKLKFNKHSKLRASDIILYIYIYYGHFVTSRIRFHVYGNGRLL